MHGSTQHTLATQRGITVTGLVVGLGIIVAVAMLGLKVIPSLLEYRSIKAGIVSAKERGGTAQDMRRAFDKSADINAVTTLSGKDLIITKNNGETDIAFDYEERIPLFTNVALVIHYAGTTDKSGFIPAKADQPPK